MVQPLWKTVWNFLQKLKMELPFDPTVPLLGLYPKSPETAIQKNLCTTMFIAAQFTIAKCWKQPSAHQQMSGSKNDGTFTQWNSMQQKERRSSYPSMTAWVELKSIMLSEIIQAVKTNTYDLTDKWNLINKTNK